MSEDAKESTFPPCIDCGEEPGSSPDGRCRDCDLAHVAAGGSCRECLRFIGREDTFGPTPAQHTAGCSLANGEYWPRTPDELAALRARKAMARSAAPVPTPPASDLEKALTCYELARIETDQALRALLAAERAAGAGDGSWTRCTELHAKYMETRDHACAAWYDLMAERSREGYRLGLEAEYDEQRRARLLVRD
jgi:hypothetical protein